MSALKIDKSNLNILKSGEKPILLDFFAEWCGPCRMVLPIIDEIANERGDIAVGKVNVEIESDLAKEYSVYSIPTLVVIRDGKEIARSVGAKNKEQILSLLR